ncbi:putative 3-oxoacyl-(acyl-carrier protein) reductase [Reticulomyxa filosa]|uniref:Putative 3-oxoacyl-(Acyl-carrier protein) reductase n=1 Tax=Reticulomyxa filosa TaxID=46433 RepID=X6PDB0_RETFI|nr:putative 3-oxoacyl-(acyl-carrier protein) reductase [Reticulomyxa filosa]|eukprot:ETO36465.1 putative 3-oxoacyl-(acyl-carrier protein) reductase [Reticulomyxa filosa]
MKRFGSQIAIITGGTRGIGHECASRLGQEGALVYLFDINPRDKTQKEADTKNKLTLRDVVVDVTNEKAVSNAVSHIIKEHGRIDILVNSAGITGKTGVASDKAELRDVQNVMNVNFFGTFICCKSVLPQMVKQNYGRIINIASISGKEGNPGQLAYASSKGKLKKKLKFFFKDFFL